MERQNSVDKEVIGGPGMVISFGKLGDKRGWGMRMEIDGGASLIYLL